MLSGRVRGRWASEDLSPYWFNHRAVHEFFQAQLSGAKAELPIIDLEIYFDVDTPGTERLVGLHNSKSEDCPGLRMRITPDEDRKEEIEAYLTQGDLPEILPTDLYDVDWRDFSGEQVRRQARGLGFAMLNANTVASSSGVDAKLRQLLRDFVTPQESAAIALQHRAAKAALTESALGDVNQRIADEGSSFGVSLKMDQSANADWNLAVAPYIEDTPFALLGQGRQVATKIALAMSRNAEASRFVLVEEPENHLSHTELQKILDRITSLSNGRQLFITTHSSFVLNRLGFDTLHLISGAKLIPLSDDVISKDTIAYFQKLSGFDTLRLATSDKSVIVEGPSDEMIFNLAYRDIKGKEPRDHGIDVMAFGISGRRPLEIAKALDKKIAVLRDNDGKDPTHWQDKVSDLLFAGKRELFIGQPDDGPTLEPQLISCNSESALRVFLGIPVDQNVEEYMSVNKTEWAWQLASRNAKLSWPNYIRDAIDFISAD